MMHSTEMPAITSLNEEINPHKTARMRELGAVDISALKADILALSESEWDKPEDFAANYNKPGVIRDVAHIIFRFGDRRTVPFRYHTLPAWRIWASRLLPIMKKAVQPLGYAREFFPRIMLARLPAQSIIAPHVDGAPSVSIPHKIHVPILTNPQCYFFERDERFHFQEGHVYEVNNAARHAAINGGDTARIHLIFECLDADLQPCEARTP